MDEMRRLVGGLMRKTVAIVVGIVVVASCVPWLRHQHFFSMLVAVTTVALAIFVVFQGVRAVSIRGQKLRQPDSAQFTWWSPRRRNLLLGAALVLALMFTVPHFIATHSGAYKLAVATAHQTPQFRDALGAPVTEAGFSEGKEELGDSATAEMVIPVRGRIRSGNLRALAIKEDGRWRLTELTLELTEPDERIDLLRSTPTAIHNP